jgi:hypothetical protein
MIRFAKQQPTDMRPPGSIVGRVGIAILIGLLMMNPVCGHPGNGAALQSERSANGESVVKPYWCLERAMRVKAMVAEANPQTGGGPIEHRRYEKEFPRKEKKTSDRADMEKHHENGRRPIQPLRLVKDNVFCDGHVLSE